MIKTAHDQLRREYKTEYDLIQKWFNDQTGIESNTWFYIQPIWKHELLLLYLFDKYKIRIETDCRFVPAKKNFMFAFIAIDEERNEQMIGDQPYATRPLAEFTAAVKCFEKIESLRATAN